MARRLSSAGARGRVNLKCRKNVYDGGKERAEKHELATTPDLVWRLHGRPAGKRQVVVVVVVVVVMRADRSWLVCVRHARCASAGHGPGGWAAPQQRSV